VTRLSVACLLSLPLVLSGCSTWSRARESTPCCIQGKPVIRRQPIAWHLFDVTVLEPLEQPFHLMRSLRKLFGIPIRASNLQDGVVPDTTFFDNRDPASLTPEQVRLGPTRPEDVAQPPFRITKPKTEGKTFGFFAEDTRGERYLLKFDPADAPELLSGAEVASSKLLYALGYHVPSYEVVFLKPEELQLTDGLMAKDRDGRLTPFGERELAALLEGQLRDGRLRVAATKILEGEVLGPARFKTFRDCADIRALKLAYAWINNIDTKDHNSLLVWDGTKTVGYLIDFGTSLGADAGLGGPKTPCAGWLNIVDLKEASLEVVTLGLHQPVCDVPNAPASPSLGFFSSYLDPDRWKPYAPNVAFAEMTEDDSEWMADRLARLSRAQVEAAVAAGQYSNPADAAYLVDTLERRRRRIIHRYVNLKEK